MPQEVKLEIEEAFIKDTATRIAASVEQAEMANAQLAKRKLERAALDEAWELEWRAFQRERHDEARRARPAHFVTDLAVPLACVCVALACLRYLGWL